MPFALQTPFRRTADSITNDSGLATTTFIYIVYSPTSVSARSPACHRFRCSVHPRFRGLSTVAIGMNVKVSKIRLSHLLYHDLYHTKVAGADSITNDSGLTTTTFIYIVLSLTSENARSPACHRFPCSVHPRFRGLPIGAIGLTVKVYICKILPYQGCGGLRPRITPGNRPM